MKWQETTLSCHWLAVFSLGVAVLAGVSTADAAEDGDDTEKGWTGDLAISVTAQSGTVDTFAGSIDAKTEKTFEKDHVSARFNGVYGTTKKRDDSRTSVETIQNSQSLNGNWKRVIQDRFFWESGTGISRDSTQDRELRVEVGTGPGYRFWQGEDGAKHHFDTTVGMGYRYEIYDGNANGPAESTDQSHFADAIVILEYKNTFFDDRVEYTHTASGRAPVNEPSSYILDTEIIFSVPISEAWSFRTSFLVEYVGDPPVDEVNNTTTRTAVGLGYTF